jgi:hypothetical protein
LLRSTRDRQPSGPGRYASHCVVARRRRPAPQGRLLLASSTARVSTRRGSRWIASHTLSAGTTRNPSCDGHARAVVSGGGGRSSRVRRPLRARRLAGRERRHSIMAPVTPRSGSPAPERGRLADPRLQGDCVPLAPASGRSYPHLAAGGGEAPAAPAHAKCARRAKIPNLCSTGHASQHRHGGTCPPQGLEGQGVYGALPGHAEDRGQLILMKGPDPPGDGRS